MAYTQEVQLSFTYQDELGTKASQVIYALADPTKTLANLLTDLQAMAGLLVAIAGAKMLSCQARLLAVPTADQTGKPVAGSRVEQTGVFDFTNTSTPRKFGEPVPSILDSVIVDGTINLADAGVSAFVAAMHAASGTSTTEPTNNSFQTLGPLADAFLSFRKHRKQLTRSSFEV